MMSQFAPWIVFAVLSTVDWRLALIVGLALQIAFVLARTPRRLGVLNGAMILFFLVMGTIALIDPTSPIKDHVNVMATAWLAIVATGSIVVGRPFTLDFSRDGASPEVVASPRFVAANRAMTAVWAAAFAGMALAGIVGQVLDAPVANTIATLLLLAGAIRFTVRYPQRVHEQAVAAHATPQAA
jgi:hypothetical protein